MKGSISTDQGSLCAAAPQRAAAEVSVGCALKAPFEADRIDRLLALWAFILGFFFVRWVFKAWQGWGVAVFAIVYCLTVAIYLTRKGVAIPRSGFFWLAAVGSTGLSYALYDNNGLETWRSLFLFCAAVYFVMSAAGRLILGRTSNWILLDGINGLFLIPFKNLGSQFKTLSSAIKIKGDFGKRVSSIALGLLLGLLVIGMVLPLLMRADSGGFYKITHGIYEYYSWLQQHFEELILDYLLAIPVAAYLFGLMAGCANDRACKTFKEERVSDTLVSVRRLVPATLYTALGLACGLYLLFIGSQLPYFFSAFAGQRPEGWQVYSEYARNGFFELCQIAAINLSLLVLANLFSKKSRREDLVLRILNGLLSSLTLLLIITAFSKMALYIGAYGLSMRRLLPCLFMAFLSVICIGVIILQKRQFSMVRLSALTGTVLLCALCLLNPDGLVAGYNADRYLSGTLATFDVEILRRSGSAGVDSAMKVYGQTEDDALKEELLVYIKDQQQKSESTSGTTRDSLQNVLARQKIGSFLE